MKQNKNMQRLILKRALPFSFAFVLMGSDIGGISVKAELDLEQEATMIEITDEKTEIEDRSLDYDDAIFEDAPFFSKIDQGSISLDDIILTRKERDFTDNANSYLENLLFGDIQNNFQNSLVIEKLNVQKFADLLSSNLVTNQILNHQNSNLYVEETDDLDWDLLFSVLKENGLANASDSFRDGNYDLSQREIIFMKEALSDDDLREWIRQLHEFLLEVRKDVPNLDMRRLACTLEDYYVCYKIPTLFDVMVFATTGSEKMTYPLFNGYYPNMEAMKQINFHEFYHLIGTSCPDEKNEYAHLSASGIQISSDAIWDDQFNQQYHVARGDYTVYFPYNYAFLEEANAEKYSSSLLQTEPFAYQEERFTVENIEFSLFLQPGFQLENFQRAALLHNPLAIMQQFPVLGITREEQEQYFFKQLEMMESYNVIHSLTQLESFVVFSEEIQLEKIAQQIAVLENYADLQMSCNFLWNLLNSKATTRPDITLEDYYYLMKLFEKRLECQRKMSIQKYSDWNLTLDDSDYIHAQEENLALFCTFLETEYSPATFDSVGSYEEYCLETGTLSNAFSEEEKCYFLSLYDEIRKNDALESNMFIDDLSQIVEEIKVYYKIP